MTDSTARGTHPSRAAFLHEAAPISSGAASFSLTQSGLVLSGS
jgi:hypothetical protein